MTVPPNALNESWFGTRNPNCAVVRENVSKSMVMLLPTGPTISQAHWIKFLFLVVVLIWPKWVYDFFYMYGYDIFN